MSNFENHSNYNCKITTDDGKEYLSYANWIHNENLDNFLGWQCDAGATRIMINEKLDIYSGECENDYLGNALTNFNLLNTHSICKQERCTGCTDDLLVSKHKK